MLMLSNNAVTDWWTNEVIDHYLYWLLKEQRKFSHYSMYSPSCRWSFWRSYEINLRTLDFILIPCFHYPLLYYYRCWRHNKIFNVCNKPLTGNLGKGIVALSTVCFQSLSNLCTDMQRWVVKRQTCMKHEGHHTSEIFSCLRLWST